MQHMHWVKSRRDTEMGSSTQGKKKKRTGATREHTLRLSSERHALHFIWIAVESFVPQTSPAIVCWLLKSKVICQICTCGVCTSVCVWCSWQVFQRTGAQSHVSAAASSLCAHWLGRETAFTAAAEASGTQRRTKTHYLNLLYGHWL